MNFSANADAVSSCARSSGCSIAGNKPASNRRLRSPLVRPSSESLAQDSTRCNSLGRRRNVAKPRFSSAFAGALPAKKRRVMWKNEAPSALGSPLFASNLSSLLRRLYFGLAPSDAGAQAPGTPGGQGSSKARPALDSALRGGGGGEGEGCEDRPSRGIGRFHPISPAFIRLAYDSLRFRSDFSRKRSEITRLRAEIERTVSPLSNLICTRKQRTKSCMNRMVSSLNRARSCSFRAHA